MAFHLQELRQAQRVNGDIDEVSRRLAASPSFAAASFAVGATRPDASTFFFSDIAHYAGDTALHMAAAAFRRPVAELIVAYGADCRAKNRRGAEPLHYAANANHWDPTAQAETIGCQVSIGADPNVLEKSGVAPLHRCVAFASCLRGSECFGHWRCVLWTLSSARLAQLPMSTQCAFGLMQLHD